MRSLRARPTSSVISIAVRPRSTGEERSPPRFASAGSVDARVSPGFGRVAGDAPPPPRGQARATAATMTMQEAANAMERMDMGGGDAGPLPRSGPRAVIQARPLPPWSVSRRLRMRSRARDSLVFTVDRGTPMASAIPVGVSPSK